jgi:dUTP pyrophosphatase
MQTLKVKRVNEDAKIPEFANTGDAGMDLFSVVKKTLNPGERALIPVGIAIELPDSTEAQIRPRSGLALNHGITILNTPGTIDEGYRGELGVILINHGQEPYEIEKHARIAQLVIKPIQYVNIVEVEEIGDSERGASGFGSSGGL